MQRAIDLRGAVAVNVITMIGIGPLVTIPLVIAALGGPLALVGWIAGAVVALCDGMVWAELSSRFPGSGGTYVYLRQAFGEKTLGRALAFLFNWQFLLYAPCLLASGYIGFANYAAYLFPVAGSNPLVHDAVAVGAGLVTVAALYRRTSQVAAVATLLAGAAVLTLLLVAVAALTHAHFGQTFHLDAPIRFGSGLLAGFGSALYITLYDYVGYADAALLGDEVVRPQRTIPLAILLSVAIVAVAYVLLQAGVLGVVPWRSLLDAHGAPTVQAQYVGSLVVELTWGRVAAIGVTILVLVTAFASLYGNLLGFSRIPFAAARDGAFLPIFAKLHPRKEIPHVALLAVGGLSLIASLFTLDQVIAFLTAGIVLIQAIAQIVALGWLRRRVAPAPFRMPLYPLPALIALIGWTLAFVYTGALAIGLGVTWLATGAIVFLFVARTRRWWPFGALCVLLLFAFPPTVRAEAPVPQWASWNASAVVTDRGYPVFTVDRKPFFVYGAAFFFERLPHDRWLPALRAYKRMGINTIDLYAIWNWQQPSPDRPPDFDGTTDPRRDLLGVLHDAHELGLKIVLRPGPVVRNEWRNGGYPAWLLERPEYDMPLHDVLEGRYPATATLQNSQADAAANEWLNNPTHLRQSQAWLDALLRAVAPYANDIVAIALDDDQGAYLDNDTWPAPHWHAYVDWLRLAVQGITGPRVPLFVNTYQMKVPAASPAWAWGDWYQSSAYAIGAHDLAELDFSTGLLQTQPDRPVMYAEFQAGWLQGADEALPRPSDPDNTALALNELLRDGVHGIVNFPLQDTIYPAGWEAPWANWYYAWDSAFAYDLARTPRFVPTARFGADVGRYGQLLARTHPAADAGIIWPPTLFSALVLTNRDFRAFADATIAMQRDCAARGMTCRLVDLAYADDATLDRFRALVLPIVPTRRLASAMDAPVARRLQRLRAAHRVVATLAALPPAAGSVRGATVLLADDRSYAFVDAVNASAAARTIGPLRVRLAARTVDVPRFTVGPRGARLLPVGLPAFAPLAPIASATATPYPFTDASAEYLGGTRLRVGFAPDAGMRISDLREGAGDNAATGIGLLRDAVDPAPPASARDYIAAYTHPLPAGTFNRTYRCAAANDAASAGTTCAYDAPDLPPGGARFERTLRTVSEGDELDVTLRFVPNDPASTAALESISGFTFRSGDVLIAPAGASYVGILHGRSLLAMRWLPNAIRRVELRAVRGAQLVTLVFSGRTAELRLCFYDAVDAAEAERILQANPRSER
ncbi:MAG TPA: amino acid permease [Candidatus Tumulicola sp.]|jgi:amino acid transporter